MNLGFQEILIIGVIILVLFGGKKIPELMRGLGKGMGEFQKGVTESKRILSEAASEEEAKPAPANPAPEANNLPKTLN